MAIEYKKVRLPSTPGWNAPGMVRNYQRARAIGDEACIKIFEAAYADQGRRFFNAIADKDYTVEGDAVLVNVAYIM